jgi:hypothetical protein
VVIVEVSGRARGDCKARRLPHGQRPATARAGPTAEERGPGGGARRPVDAEAAVDGFVGRRSVKAPIRIGPASRAKSGTPAGTPRQFVRLAARDSALQPDVTTEIPMKAKRLLALPFAALTLMPLTALADGGDREARQWLASLQSTRSAQEVRAEAQQRLPKFGDRHPVEVTASSEPTRSRAEVRAELAEYGARHVGA